MPEPDGVKRDRQRDQGSQFSSAEFVAGVQDSKAWQRSRRWQGPHEGEPEYRYRSRLPLAAVEGAWIEDVKPQRICLSQAEAWSNERRRICSSALNARDFC
jgi:hypothetical protein